MTTPINKKTGFVTKPTEPGKAAQSQPAISPKTGFVTATTAQPRPANPTLTPPESK